MKKSIIIFSALLLCACSHNNSALITGFISYFSSDALLRCITEDYRIDTIDVDNNGQFFYQANCKKPTTLNIRYIFSDGRKGSTLLYVTKGAHIDLQIIKDSTKKEVNSIITGDNCKESNFLNIHPYKGYKYFQEDGSPIPYKEFSKQVADYQKSLKSQLDGCKEPFFTNKIAEINTIIFEQLFEYYRKISRVCTYDPTLDADFMNHYSQIDINDISNYSNDINSITASYIRFQLTYIEIDFHKDEPFIMRELAYIDKNVSNDIIRENLSDLLVYYFLSDGDTNGLTEIFTIYKTISNKSNGFKYNEETYNNIMKLQPGAFASDFSLDTTEGTTIHFLDIVGHGKLIYIDCWATWCTPCCKEIPYIEKLVEYYKDNDKIEFISISLDTKKDRWLNKLAKDKPSWKQYIIREAFESSFAKEYNIVGIPRFMVFDAKGKIVDINAIRPSNKDIVNYLDSLIK